MKKGPFNIQLVYKETNEVFKEHAKEGGKTYAEVEPDAEYFVRVSSEASGTAAYVDIQVDGRLIEKGRRLTDSKSEDIGIWKRDGGYLEQNALKFKKTNPKIRNGTNNEMFAFWTGVVTALFYGDPKLMITESHHSQSSNDKSSESQSCESKSSSNTRTYLTRDSIVYTNNNDDVSGNVGSYTNIPGDDKKKKGVKTVRGKTTLSRFPRRSSSPPKKKKRSNNSSSLEAPFLCSIELNYCSTNGLIHAEILPKPPGWKYIQLREEYPRKDNWKELSEAKVEKISIEAVKRNGVTVQESKVVEFFDLSED